MQTTKVSSQVQQAPVFTEVNDGYAEFLAAITAKFAAVNHNTTLFTTSLTDIASGFINNIPEAQRPTYRCRACERFLDRYGALVTISDTGVRTSVLWDETKVPPTFVDAVLGLRKAVEKAPIEGVFVSSDAVLGLPCNRDKVRSKVWSHMAVTLPKDLVFRATALKNAGQRMAELREDHNMLSRGLAEFPLEHIRTAHTALSNGQLYRSEKCIGVAKWLLDLQESLAQAPRTGGKGVPAGRADRKDALIWRAVATAPTGYAHVRSGMIGTLLEDIAAGLPFADVKAKFDAKMHPLAYMRPQAAPSDGNIAQAEKVIGVLRTAGSLDRRFARMEDVQAWVWQPRASDTPRNGAPAGVFNALYGGKSRAAAKPLAGSGMPEVRITFEKFRREVIPTANKIEFKVGSQVNLASLVTSVNPDAPPIVQWDTEDARNAVTWFLYPGGRPAAYWTLTPGWATVSGITLQPTMWDGQPRPHLGESVFFLIEGARDTGHVQGGGLFPEHLKSDYHGVRSTLEAHFNRTKVSDNLAGTATGYKFEKGGPANDCHVRVTTGNVVTEYHIDRWD